jgi:hypothetical protein
VAYLTSTETRKPAGLVLLGLGPEISNRNPSSPLYPGDDLYDTSGYTVEPFQDAAPCFGRSVTAIESMFDLPPTLSLIVHDEPPVTCIVAGASEP